MLVEFVKSKKDGRRNGVVVCFAEGDLVLFGWSAYNAKHEERDFDRDRAIEIAIGRAYNGTQAEVPERVRPILGKMRARAYNYYGSTVACQNNMGQVTHGTPIPLY